ncbi:MAG: NAD-dependent epimerase/dehydratase family protein [Spirulinaceae cyanobacterium]
MASKRIFITGGSGCIGHYLAELLIEQTQHELFFLVRNRAKVRFDVEARPGIHLLEGDMRQIEQHQPLLKTIDIAILTANAWGGSQEVFDVNVIKTIRLLKLLDAERCEQVFYFSTASILGRDNKPLPEAKQLGTEYIRSKYDCLSQLHRLELAPKITVVFPTLVFGGSETKPYSHLSGGLPDVVRWVGLIRLFKADASFHFLHARDIAQVITYLVDHPLPYQVVNELDDIYVKQIVLGNPALHVNNAVREICAYFGKRIWFQIDVSKWLANALIRLFRIQVGAWDRFCMDYRHFTYHNPVNPETFGLTTFCPTLSDIFLATGIRGKAMPPLSREPMTKIPAPDFAATESGSPGAEALADGVIGDRPTTEMTGMADPSPDTPPLEQGEAEPEPPTTTSPPTDSPLAQQEQPPRPTD